MKNILRTLVLILTLAVAMPALYAETYGYTEKEIKANQKAAVKQAKAKAKELKKEKWVYSGAMPLEKALENFLLNTEFTNGMYREATQTIDDAPTIKRGESMARSAVENDFVREIQIAVQGTIEEQSGNANGRYSEVQVDTYSKMVANELKGDVKKFFTVYRKKANGSFEVRVFYSIPELANSGQFRRQVQDNIEFGRAIRGHINEAFNAEDAE